MAKILRDLLDATEPMFSLSLQQLEKASGQTGVDVQLIGEIVQKMNRAIEGLGLDPRDSTGREVFRAQMNRIHEDAARMTRIIGGTDPSDVKQLVPLMVAAAQKADVNKNCWVLKHSVAKQLLKKMPPKKLMEKLGYRSVDSMLKHEDIDEIYTALRFSEGAEWLNEYNELFKQVKPSDFESREIRILAMDHDKYVDLADHFVKKKLHNITHTKEMGTIVVVPMHATRMKGIVLKSLPLIFHYINEIRLYSAFFKLKQVSKNFGETVVETLIADPGNASQMAGQNVHWRVIQRYYGRPTVAGEESHPEAFTPHVHPEDLHWRRANEILYDLDPKMEFWKDLDYVARFTDGAPLTFNLLDVSFAYTNDEKYENRYSYHFRESLWNEIFMRYMGKKNLETQILQQLDNDMVAPEKLPLPIRSKEEVSADEQRVSKIEMRQRMIDAAEGRLIGVTEEFARAFDILEKYEKAVTIFGSARFTSDHPSYKDAYEIASRLATKGYAIVSGGGYGIMEAANKGAYDTGGASIGFNINLPTEQHLNDYTTENYEFEHFFGRKVAMTLEMSAFVYMPGGFGTLDELFEIVTLQQTGKIPRVPIILFDTKFWKPLLDYFAKQFAKGYKTIATADLDMFIVTDSIDKVVKTIEEHKGDQYQEPKGKVPHPEVKK